MLHILCHFYLNLRFSFYKAKKVSKCYEYKLKSILKKKVLGLLDSDLPLLSALFPNLMNLTKFSKIRKTDNRLPDITKNCKTLVDHRNQNISPKAHIHENTTRDTGNFHPTRPSRGVISEGIPKYYINNPSRLIKTAVGSGGVEVINQSSHTVRLSISPSQGDDPGFKSRPEHPLFSKRRPV